MPRTETRSCRKGPAILLLAALAIPAAPPPASALSQPVAVKGDPADYEKARNQLFAALAAAPDEATARRIAANIWRLWFQAPDAEAEQLMEEVQERRLRRDLATALKLLDRLVAQAPGWAEAWNQRATIRFMVGDYEGSLADIDQVLPLEPKHFGALSGEAMILMRLGRNEEAQTALRRAVEINPFLIERVLLEPQPEGEDI
jgi:tetratricopeptide (TPR) repeat protein